MSYSIAFSALAARSLPAKERVGSVPAWNSTRCTPTSPWRVGSGSAGRSRSRSMARASGLAERGSAVSLQFLGADDVGLAEQARLHPAELDLVTKGRGRDPEFGGGFGEGEHPLLLLALAHEVGLDLAEPALHRLAAALVGPDPDLVGVEAVGVVPGVAKGPLELGPAIGPFL